MNPAPFDKVNRVKRKLKRLTSIQSNKRCGVNFVVILASGKGKRFGQQKQFILIKNKPIIFYSIEKFNKSPVVDKIIIVTIKNKIGYIKNLVKQYNFKKVLAVIVGGKERQDSVRNALKILPSKGYVAIHDSARPLFSSEIIMTGFKSVKKHKACIPIMPIQDTIKQVKGRVVIKTLDRSQVYYVQTPQFFELSLLKNGYAQADKEHFVATDDASLIERLGYKVHTFQGQKQNIKITDKQDLIQVRKLL
jgi:2-C-methyl-D-erythritol 4-phosphate cytidylyltransferase